MKQVHRRVRILMGSPLEVSACGDAAPCALAIQSAFLEVERIERIFSVYRPESPLARLNESLQTGSGLFSLEDEILQVLAQALRDAKISGGAFDPSAGPLINLWGFGSEKKRTSPPSHTAIASALQSSGFQDLHIDTEKGQIEALKKGMCLNLGGIAKGYAIDRAVSVLKMKGISRGLVSFGSSTYGFGTPGWRMAIQDPRKGGAIETLTLFDQALATSGDYERCFVYQGKRFSHLIDPRSGQPVSGMASVSVLAPTAMAADALSTAAFVLGKDAGETFLEKIPEIAGLLISDAAGEGLRVQPTKNWGGNSLPSQNSRPSPPLSRRRFLALLCAGLAGLVFPWVAEGRTVRYASEKEVLLKTLPDAKKFVVEKVLLTADQLKQAQEMAGKGFRKKKYLFLVGKNGEETLGYGIVLNVVGKKRPITFMIVITPEGKIKAIEVLLYRETKGFQIRHARFMTQFHEKTKADPLRLGQDIRSISGATLSSRAAAYAVRKALAIFDVSIRQGKNN